MDIGILDTFVRQSDNKNYGKFRKINKNSHVAKTKKNEFRVKTQPKTKTRNSQKFTKIHKNSRFVFCVDRPSKLNQSYVVHRRAYCGENRGKKNKQYTDKLSGSFVVF